MSRRRQSGTAVLARGPSSGWAVQRGDGPLPWESGRPTQERRRGGRVGDLAASHYALAGRAVPSPPPRKRKVPKLPDVLPAWWVVVAVTRPLGKAKMPVERSDGWLACAHQEKSYIYTPHCWAPNHGWCAGCCCRWRSTHGRGIPAPPFAARRFPRPRKKSRWGRATLDDHLSLHGMPCRPSP